MTTGTPENARQALVGYANYALPSQIRPTDDTARTAPIRLAFLDTPDAGRILCHSVYVGRDPTTGRFGNFFSHVLHGVPPEITCEHAIQMWRASFWQCDDADDGTELQALGQLPAGGVFQPSDFVEFLSNAKQLEIFRFLLAAVLTTPDDARIFLMASADAIAKSIYGLTLALPVSATRCLYFSTYESEPLLCKARVIGTWLGDSRDVELPSSCYGINGVALNAYTGRCTEIVEPSVVPDIIKLLSQVNGHKQVEAFRVSCEQCGVQAQSIDMVYRATNKGLTHLTKEELLSTLTNEKLAPRLLAGRQVSARDYEYLAKWAAEDFDFLQRAMPVALDILGQHPELASRFPNLDSSARNLLESWIILRRFTEKPSLNPIDINSVAAALVGQPSDLYGHFRNDVIQSIFKALRQLPNQSAIQGRMETSIFHLSNGLSTSWQVVYAWFVDQLGDEHSQTESYKMILISFIRIGLGAARAIDLQKVNRKTISGARHLLACFRKNYGKEAVKDAWKKKVHRWPPLARRRWKRYSGTSVNRAIRTIWRF